MIDLEDKALDIERKLSHMTLPRMLALIQNERVALMKIPEGKLNLESGRLPMDFVCAVYDKPVPAKWIEDDLRATFELNKRNKRTGYR